ncbi:MAG TPA: orotate phosphoribosyltransferase [Bacteroidales bacterium]|nr:orotate phosphoribosyltransferase [Bacteroidales bacterium]
MNQKEKIVSYLLQSNAIKLDPANPFTWASGWKSPIYCDNRKTLSYPPIRSFIQESFVNLINEKFGRPDVIAGVATGAIAQGALVADRMKLPFIYVRSSAKDHGLENLIEGDLKPGQKAVIVEDLVSTGGSSLKALHALRQAGANVQGMTAIFTYGFPIAEQNFNEAGCALFTLSDYNTLIEYALKTGSITEDQVGVLKMWRQDPAAWMKK